MSLAVTQFQSRHFITDLPMFAHDTSSHHRLHIRITRNRVGNIQALRIKEGSNKHYGLWKLLRFSSHEVLCTATMIMCNALTAKPPNPRARPVPGERSIETASVKGDKHDHTEHGASNTMNSEDTSHCPVPALCPPPVSNLYSSRTYIQPTIHQFHEAVAIPSNALPIHLKTASQRPDMHASDPPPHDTLFHMCSNSATTHRWK